VKQTVAAPVRHEGEPIKGSRFIVDVVPVADEPQAREALAGVAAEFADASHHCWAWRISVESPEHLSPDSSERGTLLSATSIIERASDDGEPSGSAGRPILAQLAGRHLVDTAVIVTRYFGGTKLGVGGLVRAYGRAAGQALDTMRLQPWIETCELRFDHGYPHTDAIERLVGDRHGVILDRTFGADVGLHVRLPIDQAAGFADGLADLTAGVIVLTSENNGLPN